MIHNLYEPTFTTAFVAIRIIRISHSYNPPSDLKQFSIEPFSSVICNLCMVRQNSDYKYKFLSIKVGRISTIHAHVLLLNDFPNVSQWLNYV